ncbi:MAG: hypothetical protein LBK82_00915 [Planctomycetaceae bacterium]|nr:hypothetical protein [Planctomycetaceae bacterium]
MIKFINSTIFFVVLLVKSGIIVDGTFVDVLKQDFSKDDYAQIKKGDKPASRTCKPAVRSQTDFDARYTRKNNEK